MLFEGFHDFPSLHRFVEGVHGGIEFALSTVEVAFRGIHRAIEIADVTVEQYELVGCEARVLLSEDPRVLGKLRIEPSELRARGIVRSLCERDEALLALDGAFALDEDGVETEPEGGHPLYHAHQRRKRCAVFGVFVHALAKEMPNRLHLGEREIDARIASGNVCPDINEIFCLAIGRH